MKINVCSLLGLKTAALCVKDCVKVYLKVSKTQFYRSVILGTQKQRLQVSNKRLL